MVVFFLRSTKGMPVAISGEARHYASNDLRYLEKKVASVASICLWVSMRARVTAYMQILATLATLATFG